MERGAANAFSPGNLGADDYCALPRLNGTIEHFASRTPNEGKRVSSYVPPKMRITAIRGDLQYRQFSDPESGGLLYG
jgi:hypothetical protein